MIMVFNLLSALLMYHFYGGKKHWIPHFLLSIQFFCLYLNDKCWKLHTHKKWIKDKHKYLQMAKWDNKEIYVYNFMFFFFVLMDVRFLLNLLKLIIYFYILKWLPFYFNSYVAGTGGWLPTCAHKNYLFFGLRVIKSIFVEKN